MLGALKFNSAKCDTTCRLCLGRIKLLKNKRNMQMKQYRRDIAELLRAGKQDYARIRVEAVIREAFTLTAYEILELYLELLAVRSSLVANSKEIPRDMIEALSSVLYATSRVPDLPELTTLHKMFAQKYGKEYVSEACSDVSCRRWMVNENLQRCLTVEPPEPALKLETLSEIAQEYGVEWDMYRAQQDILPKDPPGGGTSVPLPCIPAVGTQVQQQLQQPPHLQQQGYGQPAAPAAPPPAAPAATPAASSGIGQVPPGSTAGHGGYADVAAAAAAAVAAAQQARSAAEAATRLAGAAARPPHTPGSPPLGSRGGGGGGGGGMAVPAAGSAAAAGPPDGWLSAAAQQQAAAAGASGPPAAAGAPLQMQPLPKQQQPPGFRMPSAEEIQQAYDSAQGPPAKPTAAAGSDAAPVSDEAAVAPPGAPPVRDEEASAAAASADGQCGSSTGDLTGLPGVPHSGASAAPSSSAVSSEYDELQKRFEALKKA